MESARLGEKAVEKGNYLIERLNELKEKYPLIGDVRGIGLMTGVELVEDIKTPAVDKRDTVINRSLEGVLILLPAGDSVIRFVPPLIIKKSEFDKGLEIFEGALKSI